MPHAICTVQMKSNRYIYELSKIRKNYSFTWSMRDENFYFVKYGGPKKFIFWNARNKKVYLRNVRDYGLDYVKYNLTILHIKKWSHARHMMDSDRN